MANKPEKTPASGRRLGRKGWIRAAKAALIEGGVEAVKVGLLAKSVNAIRAGFYYHFKDREELLSDLLKYWERSNTQSWEQAVSLDNHDGMEEFNNLVEMLVEEKDYDPAFDSAVRNWAQFSKHAARAVRRIDRKRINLLCKIYHNLGFAEDEAFIRARIFYFHQVGYYTLDLHENRKRRRELLPLYVKALTGK